MRCITAVVIAALLVGVAVADCPQGCVCEEGSDVCASCAENYHNIGENEEVFCCSNLCDQCQDEADYCITCPAGQIAVDGVCVNSENSEYSSGASSSTKPPPTPAPKSPSPSPATEEGGLQTWHYILIGVGGAIVLAALVVAIVCIVRHCVKGSGPSMGVTTSQHDVLFDDEDDVDLTPVSKKKAKNVDDDAFI